MFDLEISAADTDTPSFSLELLKNIINTLNIHKSLYEYLLHHLDEAAREFEKEKVDQASKTLNHIIDTLEREIVKNEKEEWKNKEPKKISSDDAGKLIFIVRGVLEGVVE